MNMNNPTFNPVSTYYFRNMDKQAKAWTIQLRCSSYFDFFYFVNLKTRRKRYDCFSDKFYFFLCSQTHRIPCFKKSNNAAYSRSCHTLVVGSLCYELVLMGTYESYSMNQKCLSVLQKKKEEIFMCWYYCHARSVRLREVIFFCLRVDVSVLSFCISTLSTCFPLK